MKKDAKRIGAGVLAAALAAAAAVAAAKKPRQEGADALWTAARRGELVIDLSEDGEIKPSQQITLKSEVPGRNSILFIVPEGSMVQEGDLLVELDVASKRDELVNQEIAVQNAESALEMKREDLEIAKNQAASDVELAELDLAFAKEDLVKYEEGEYPNKLSEVKGSVALAEQELEQARQKYEWSKKLHSESFLSESELKGDELSFRHSELSLQTARGNLALLETYTHKRELAKLRSDERQKTAALDRIRRRAASAILQEESSLRAKQSEYNRQKQKLETLQSEIAKARIVAPMAGQVIYATSNARPWDNNEPLKEGVEVWERRDLIILPTADTFIASTTIHESALSAIATGMPVRVECDALPGREFAGTLERVAPMPDTGRRWMNPDLKEYPAEVSLEGGVGELKSGMGCRVRILVAKYDDAVSVPVQCVVRVGGEPCVWTKGRDGAPERRKVELGLDNGRFVHVLAGLEGGEPVMLAPPLDTSEKPESGAAPEENGAANAGGGPAEGGTGAA
ncbi:MAG: HlyD family efflux transporter periplasmic adaptor subunit [Kiritimatiellae bacterium]|nr:HlyD family efflux transporter periplasmic adaptor subunit [Kiritimatiellia bacterium]MBR1835745.1 HlyD family efflux transporter periplasmic adaptor subunit [Kiritimatiellia bacterium]